MIKKRSLTIAAVIIASVCLLLSGCDKSEVKETSTAGAYYLMFSEIAEQRVDLTEYKYLSFDKASTGLEGEELDILEGMIKEYCEEKGLAYLDMDMTRLRRSFRIVTGAKGKEFQNGYLLTFSNCGSYVDDELGEVFTGNVELWHGDFSAVGGLDFKIIKTEKGWYIQRSLENGGYDVMIS